jgi:pyruvate,water dikinase
LLCLKGRWQYRNGRWSLKYEAEFAYKIVIILPLCSNKNSNRKKLILTGIGASPGTAYGRAKIILSPNDVSKMDDGNILITVMTNPLFVVAMGKAKAIVTDVGGMLCHAAIVARELGIPCVVGTEKATKALKDNMEIVVDGTEGKIYACA